MKIDDREAVGSLNTIYNIEKELRREKTLAEQRLTTTIGGRYAAMIAEMLVRAAAEPATLGSTDILPHLLERAPGWQKHRSSLEAGKVAALLSMAVSDYHYPLKVVLSVVVTEFTRCEELNGMIEDAAKSFAKELGETLGEEIPTMVENLGEQ